MAMQNLMECAAGCGAPISEGSAIRHPIGPEDLACQKDEEESNNG